jgi:CheY-like chemotaxis protein
MTGETAPPLAILVVDDEAMIAMLLRDILEDRGCEVVGPAGAVAPALALIQAGGRALDGAILDINLRGELVYPVADVLIQHGVPFVFVTGYAKHQIDPRYAKIIALPKPFPSATIDRLIRTFQDQRRARYIV